jgi:hypothetical protein
VKCDIRRDAITACGHLSINGAKCHFNLGKLYFRSALGGQCCRFRFDGATEFDDLKESFAGFNDRVVYLERADRGLETDKNSATLAGFEKAPVLQSRNRLPHHGPTYAELWRKHRLRWKLLAGLELSRLNPGK